jgi:hypothetical protein
MPEVPLRRAFRFSSAMNSDGVTAGGVTAEAISQHQAQVSALLQQHFGLSPGEQQAASVFHSKLCRDYLWITVIWPL